jgi:hypothetical protein
VTRDPWERNANDGMSGSVGGNLIATSRHVAPKNELHASGGSGSGESLSGLYGGVVVLTVFCLA